MLSVCGDRDIERGIPRRPFYPRDLEPGIYKKARAVCTAAGVKVESLLDACTLDVAVIGNDEAAKVFVGAPAPIAVGNITATSGWPGLRVWLLSLFLLAVILIILWMILVRKKRTSP